MANNSYPKYEVEPLSGGGWYVIVTPRQHRAPFEYYGFISEADAQDWICEEMNVNSVALGVRVEHYRNSPNQTHSIA